MFHIFTQNLNLMDEQTSKLNTLYDFSNRSNITSTYKVADTLEKETNIDFSGLSDAEKMALYIYVFECNDTCVFVRTICRYFGWSRYKVVMLRKQINENKKLNYHIDIVPTFNESNGLLSGNGYTIDIFTHKR